MKPVFKHPLAQVSAGTGGGPYGTLLRFHSDAPQRENASEAPGFEGVRWGRNVACLHAERLRTVQSVVKFVETASVAAPLRNAHFQESKSDKKCYYCKYGRACRMSLQGAWNSEVTMTPPESRVARRESQCGTGGSPRRRSHT